MMEQAVTDYVGATILALTPHFTPVASWDDPGMPAAAIVLDGYRRQITWTPDSGWRYTRLHTGTAAQRGPAYYLDAGPVPAPQVVVDRLRRWQSGGEAWSLTQPSYPPGGVLEALRAAVPDAARLRSCPDCGRWRDVDPGEHARCETCGTDLPQRAALDVDDAGEVERLRAELAEPQRVAAALRASQEEMTVASSPVTPEMLDELVDTDPLRLRDVAAALLAQVHGLAAERNTARAELAEERARHAELVAEMQRTRTAHARAETELDAIRDAGGDATALVIDLLRQWRFREDVDEHELAALIVRQAVDPAAGKLRQAQAQAQAQARVLRTGRRRRLRPW